MREGGGVLHLVREKRAFVHEQQCVITGPLSRDIEPRLPDWGGVVLLGLRQMFKLFIKAKAAV